MGHIIRGSLAKHSVFLIVLTFLGCLGSSRFLYGAESQKPYLPIRLMNLNTYGKSIGRWIEPGTVNFAQIKWVGHNLCRYDFRPEEKTPEFLASVDKSRSELKSLAEQAHSLGLLAYLNEYEIDYPGFVSRESLLPPSAREEFMEHKIYEILTQCPWIEGYMITPTESRLGAANPEELKAVVMGAYKGMKRAEKELGKKRYLFVRSWLSAASSLAKVREYFPITTDPEIAKDIIIVSKDGLGDFVMRRPLNPLFGCVQPHSILAEFDVSVSEYKSLGWYPQGPAELWGYRIQQLAQTPGVVGVNIHTGRLSELPGLSPEEVFPRFKESRVAYGFQGGVKWSPWHHLSIYSFYRLLKNPWESPRRIYEDWASENYGKKAAKPMADILMLADDALYHGMLTFGVNLNNHSHFVHSADNPIEAHASVIKYHLRLQPQLSPLMDVNSDTADRALAEKRLAGELVDNMIDILDRSKSDFSGTDYKDLKTELLRMRGALHGYTLVQAGFYAYQMAIMDAPVPSRDYYIKIVHDMVQEGEELVKSKPEFLHQTGTGSFIHMTRAYKKGLEQKGLW